MRRVFGLIALIWLLCGFQGALAEGNAQIRLFGYDQRAGEVVLYANGRLVPKSFHLDHPERWVIDVPNAHYSGSTLTLPAIANSPVKAVRIAEFKRGTVRIVFDLEHATQFPEAVTALGPSNYRLAFKVAAGSGASMASRPAAPAHPAVRPKEPPARVREPVRTKEPPARKEAVTSQSEPTATSPGLSLHRWHGGWQLSITTQAPFTYSMAQKSRSDRLSFDLQGAGSELPKDSLYVDNGLIARVRIVTLNAHTSRVIIEFDQPLRYSLAQAGNHQTLVVSLGNAAEGSAQTAIARPRRPGERRVTIDAGHGGVDPGTVSAHGVREKDVTLQMALRLQKLMQASGMEVQMTRTKDMQILLHPRVDIGDAFDSDVFISIHANHISNPKVSGIETYYFTPKSLSLARAVHKKLVQTLQRPDRGVRRNNFVVVKYNKMPACLVEIGYLSNPTEERLLTNPRYQQRAAEAIVAGVQEYFRTRSLRQ